MSSTVSSHRHRRRQRGPPTGGERRASPHSLARGLVGQKSRCRVAGGAQFRAAVPTGSGFLPPPPRTVRAVLPHTAHRRPSPSAFGFPVQGLNGLGATTVPLRLISPIRFVDR